jgi:co-chaperonin GroES (HSP10)
MERTVPAPDRVERAARKALHDKKPKPDLLKRPPPFTPGSWNILVEPIEPKEESKGGIILAPITTEADGYQVTIGRVIRCGPTAFEGETTSKISLGHFTDDIRTPRQLVGKYVVFQRHTGHDMFLRETEQKLKVLTLQEILGVTDDPDAWRFYV